MSYTAVNEMIAKMVYDAKVNTINEFKTFLADKIEIEDMEEDFATFINTLKESAPLPEKKGRGKGNKKSENSDEKKSKKRQPTLFNLFVKNKMATIKAENSDKKGKEIIALASESWKSDAFAAFLQNKNQIDALKEENQDLSNELLFEKAKIKFNELAEMKPAESKTLNPKAQKAQKEPKAPKEPKAQKETKPKSNKKGGKKQPEPQQESDAEIELGEEAFPDLDQDD